MIRTKQTPAAFLFLILALSQAALSSQAQEQPLTNADVVKMVKAGLSEDLIIQRIKTAKTGFDLSTDQILKLKDASVPESIIKAMLASSAEPGISATPPTPPPTPAVTPEPIRPAPSQTEIMLWRQRYDSARSKKNSGWALAGAGLGTMGGGLALFLMRYEDVTIVDPYTGFVYTFRVCNKTRRNASVALYASGAGLWLWGIIRRNSGASEMHRLEAEGRSKGYITLGPSPDGRGVMVSYNLTF